MLTRRFCSRLLVARTLAVLLATSLVFQLGQVRASPGDIFTQAAPLIGADPAKAADLRTGDASVSTQTGALQYSYPITVPPGRGGMAPDAALNDGTTTGIAAWAGAVGEGLSNVSNDLTSDHSDESDRVYSSDGVAQSGVLKGATRPKPISPALEEIPVVEVACGAARTRLPNPNLSRRPPIERGPGGGKKHTPGHNRKSNEQRKQSINKKAERRLSKQEQWLAAKRATFSKLPEKTQTLHGGFDTWIKKQKPPE
ncbi:MAG: hypothetical protein ABL907_07540 [Hyphomicrobium sp.]